MKIKLRARLKAYSKFPVFPIPSVEDAGSVLGVDSQGKYTLVPGATNEDIDDMFGNPDDPSNPDETRIYFNTFSDNTDLEDGTHTSLVRILASRLQLQKSSSGTSIFAYWMKDVDISSVEDSQNIVFQTTFVITEPKSGHCITLNDNVVVETYSTKVSGENVPAYRLPDSTVKKVSDYGKTDGLILRVVVNKGTGIGTAYVYNNGIIDDANLDHECNIDLGPLSNNLSVQFGISKNMDMFFDDLFVGVITTNETLSANNLSW